MLPISFRSRPSSYIQFRNTAYSSLFHTVFLPFCFLNRYVFDRMYSSGINSMLFRLLENHLYNTCSINGSSKQHTSERPGLMFHYFFAQYRSTLP